MLVMVRLVKVLLVVVVLVMVVLVVKKLVVVVLVKMLVDNSARYRVQLGVMVLHCFEKSDVFHS